MRIVFYAMGLMCALTAAAVAQDVSGVKNKGGQSAVCNPRPYGLKKCPDDIQAFLEHVAGCDKLSRGERDKNMLFSSWENAKCEWDSCEHEILSKKYVNDTAKQNLLRKELIRLMGTEDFSFDMTCNELIQEKMK